MKLFTDSSVSPDTGFGVGGYLLLQRAGKSSEALSDSVQLKSFKDVSSTELELRTLIWALSELEEEIESLSVYTDSQNILNLIERRERLEKSDFRNSSCVELKHASLYREFYVLLDEMGFEVNKVRGHSRIKDRNEIEKVFSVIDRMTRKELRECLKTRRVINPPASYSR